MSFNQREEELLTKMDELKKEVQDVSKEVITMKTRLATENEEQIEDINDNMKQIEFLNSLLDRKKSTLLNDLQEQIK